ncbi:MAG: type II secretion system F family protein [Aquihabitans sp.]
MTVIPVMVLVSGGITGIALLSRWAAVGSRQAALRRRLDARPAAVQKAPPWFARALTVLEVTAEPDRIWPTVRTGGVTCALVVAVWWPWLTVVLAVLGGVAVVTRPAVLRRRRVRDYDAEVAAAVEVLTSSLMSGASLHQAFEAAARRPGPVGNDLVLVTRAVHQGNGLQPALDRWAQLAPGRGPVLLADALAITTGSGGSHAGAIAGVGATLREREAHAREVRALGTQARLSAAVLVVTPLGFAAVAALLDGRVASLILTTPLGWACLVGGLILDGFGAWWMHRLTGAVG